MNEAEVNRQIQQMVQFIRQEAEEKANEIAVATEEVCISTWTFTAVYRESHYFVLVYDVFSCIS